MAHLCLDFIVISHFSDLFAPASIIQLDYEDYEEEEDDDEASSAEDSEPKEDDEDDVKNTKTVSTPASANSADALTEAVSKLDINGSGGKTTQLTDEVESTKDWPGVRKSMAGLDVKKGEGILDSEGVVVEVH